MTHFVRYQHCERLDPDNIEVNGLLDGKVYVFHKIDGTNASIWMDDGKLHFGKRSQELGEGDDNKGFKAKYKDDPRFVKFFEAHPNTLLYGEWLVPHTIKTYLGEAWNKFYVFDVCETNEEGEITRYISYDEYKDWLTAFDIDFVPALHIVDNPTIDEIKSYVEENHYLLPPGEVGEGIVIKRYDYVNPFGRTTWGKVVRDTFKANSRAKFKGAEGSIESKIVDDLFTYEFVSKEYYKIKEVCGEDVSFEQLIPRAIGTIPYVFVTEEIGTILKKYKKPTIDFAKLHKLCGERVKSYLGW